MWVTVAHTARLPGLLGDSVALGPELPCQAQAGTGSAQWGWEAAGGAEGAPSAHPWLRLVVSALPVPLAGGLARGKGWDIESWSERDVCQGVHRAWLGEADASKGWAVGPPSGSRGLSSPSACCALGPWRCLHGGVAVTVADFRGPGVK